MGERFRELDTPLLLEWPNGKREALLFIFEEETKSSTFSIHRLAHYCLDMAELMKTERVVPVVIFLNSGRRSTALTLGSDRYTYLICDLKQLSAEAYQDSDNIVVRINLPNMRHPRKKRLQQFLAAQLGLIRNEPTRIKSVNTVTLSIIMPT